jgi:aspartate carbamoyltransferase catalytic subunit
MLEKSESGCANKFIWKRKHLLGLEELSREEIVHILDTAETFKDVSTRSVKKVPAPRDERR